MFPWYFMWAPYFAPQWTSPLGGAVTQAFSLDAFFGAIDPGAGNGNVERAVFNYASYGRQIGTLSDTVALLLNLVDVSSAVPPDKADQYGENRVVSQITPEKAAQTIEQFVETYRGIEVIKDEFKQSRVGTVARILDTMKEVDLKIIERVVQDRLWEERNPRK